MVSGVVNEQRNQKVSLIKSLLKLKKKKLLLMIWHGLRNHHILLVDTIAMIISLPKLCVSLKRQILVMRSLSLTIMVH
ncbi:Uncharacterised protein [Citrobacter werkmanii]|nr:Uncharacterised protein [Citrobacter werkmanii]